MDEIWIPECIAVLFLLLSAARPLVKGLWPLDGLAWLPLLSLAITLGLYPAYGFRPETLPLLLFELPLVILNLPAMGAAIAFRPSDTYRDRNPVFTAAALVLCAAAGVFALAFSPKMPETPPGEARTLAIRDESRGRDYFLRIYRPADHSRPRPLLFVIPPEAGSVSAIDWICGSLRSRGFTVITYSRRNFDFPAWGEGGRRYFCPPRHIYNLWSAFYHGARFKTANDRGRALEAARVEDIEFLLPHIILNRGNGTLPLVMAGYGAGGAALVQMAASPPALGAWNARVGGIVAVEPGFWGLYRPEERRRPDTPAGPGRPWQRIQDWAAGLRPQQTGGLEPVSPPDLPALYLVSDRVQDQPPETDPYRALREILRTSSRPAALVYLEGAGPLDYTGHPLTNPVYSALFPGRNKRLPAGPDPAAAAVEVMAGFAQLLAGPGAGTAAGPETAPAGETAVSGLHIETRSWNLPDLRGILPR